MVSVDVVAKEAVLLRLLLLLKLLLVVGHRLKEGHSLVVEMPLPEVTRESFPRRQLHVKSGIVLAVWTA